MKALRKKRPEIKNPEYERFLKLLNELTPWHRFLVLQLINWMVFKHKIMDLPVRWVKFQLDLENDLKRFGMPHKLHWLLVTWFNRRPFPDTNKSFMCNGKKIWHHYFLEKHNFEFHLRYKDELPGLIWFKLKRDGTAKVLIFNIRENFRNAGLGTFVFQESVKLLKDRVTCIEGVLQKKYDPNYEDSLRWLRKQGFEITQKKNDDYEFKFWVNK